MQRRVVISCSIALMYAPPPHPAAPEYPAALSLTFSSTYQAIFLRKRHPWVGFSWEIVYYFPWGIHTIPQGFIIQWEILGLNDSAEETESLLVMEQLQKLVVSLVTTANCAAI